MKPYQLIGWTLENTTAVTAIVGTGLTTIWHGLRPKTQSLPSINYFRLGGGVRHNGWESIVYTINCRSATAGDTEDLARAVMDAFIGTSSTSMQGINNGFAVTLSTLANDNGLIPEPEDDTFNNPVDIRIVYPSQTVS